MRGKKGAWRPRSITVDVTSWPRAKNSWPWPYTSATMAMCCIFHGQHRFSAISIEPRICARKRLPDTVEKTDSIVWAADNQPFSNTVEIREAQYPSIATTRDTQERRLGLQEKDERFDLGAGRRPQPQVHPVGIRSQPLRSRYLDGNSSGSGSYSSASRTSNTTPSNCDHFNIRPTKRPNFGLTAPVSDPGEELVRDHSRPRRVCSRRPGVSGFTFW